MDGGDQLFGNLGDDILTGGLGADLLQGNQDDDVLYGNQDADQLLGGQGSDRLYGGQGDDVLAGGIGDDRLFGNLGNDVFVFAGGFGHDVIGDFRSGDADTDVIRFQAGTFASYAEVQSRMVQQGNDVFVTLDAGNDIRLLDTAIATLTADRFLFG